MSISSNATSPDKRVGTPFRRAVLMLATLVAALVMPNMAFADDWIAERLRGEVFAFDGNVWVPLSRGDIVSDDRAIKTLPSARVTFVRGNETIELASNTQIRIVDATGRKFTTVFQDSGSVTVEADRMQIQHFSVQTPFLAAVVKGTQFTVTVGEERALVNVSSGIVQVEDKLHAMQADIRAGQRVSVVEESAMGIVGRNASAVMILAADGTLLTQGQAKALVASGGNGNNAGKGNSGQGLALGQSNGGGNNGNANGQGNGNANGQENGNSNGNGNGQAGDVVGAIDDLDDFLDDVTGGSNGNSNGDDIVDKAMNGLKGSKNNKDDDEEEEDV